MDFRGPPGTFLGGKYRLFGILEQVHSFMYMDLFKAKLFVFQPQFWKTF